MTTLATPPIKQDTATPSPTSIPVANTVFFAFLGLLIFIFPIPETIALRQFLLLGCLLTTFFSRPPRNPLTRPLISWLLIMTVWFIVQLVAIAPAPLLTFEELHRQWLPATLCAALGCQIYAMAQQRQWSMARLMSFMVACLMSQAIFACAAASWVYLKTGEFPTTQTLLTTGKLEVSFWNNLTLIILATDGLARALQRRQLTQLSNTALVSGAIFLLISNVLFHARNGIIEIILTTLICCAILLFKYFKSLRIASITSTVAICIIASVGSAIIFDQRLEQIRDTAALAWMIEQHSTWLDGITPLPLLPSGTEVEISGYFRVSWFRAGLAMIPDYPLGLGYGRTAFAQGLRMTYGQGIGHSHSGVIDWTLATGLPGLALWLCLMGWGLRLAGRAYFKASNPWAILPILLIVDFNLRSIIDSVNRDHMLMVYFILFGLTLSLLEESKSKTSNL